MLFVVLCDFLGFTVVRLRLWLSCFFLCFFFCCWCGLLLGFFNLFFFHFFDLFRCSNDSNYWLAVVL